MQYYFLSAVWSDFLIKWRPSWINANKAYFQDMDLLERLMVYTTYFLNQSLIGVLITIGICGGLTIILLNYISSVHEYEHTNIILKN